MSTVEKSIEVNVPVSTAYDQWTQFEQFPRFMEGVEEVRQLDDKRLHWRAQIAGKQEEWDAEIIEQVPDQRIAWRSTSGVQNNGAVTFEPIEVNRTQVTLRLDYQPQSFVEKAGDALGFVSSRVEGDLKRFKEFIESRGAETGAWRGEIHGGEVERGTPTGAIGAQAERVTPGTAGATDYETTTGGPTASETTATAYGSTRHVDQPTDEDTIRGTTGTTDYATPRADLDREEEATVPIVEEDLRVGKREAESGGARVTTRVEEEPVEEQVTLRDETVDVERRPADRPASEADLAALQEGTIEARERHEEPVTEKQARVVGEVGIRKDVEERTETVQDTVRRTDVDVEDTSGRTRATGSQEPGSTSTER